MNQQQEAAPEAKTDAQSMALRALSTARQFLGAVQREAPELIAGLREGRTQEAGAKLGFLLDGLGSLTRLAVDLVQVKGADEDVGVDFGAMARSLADLVRHQEANDWEATAALIETEIAPQLSAWDEFFQIQIEKIR
ncbi:MAG: hypothetical protein Q9Q13_10190 [Acidobacteriota bacterium]|nr:hypothetical protein [Acidobacteriota bacterium]